MKQLRLTELQQKIYDAINKHKEIYTSEVAKIVYKSVKKEHRPKDINNSIISSVIQINRKYPKLIKGYNRGCLGKLLFF